MPRNDERREALKACAEDARGCTRCPELAASRTQVVFGTGDPDADVMFVGEAPDRQDDALGVPLAGRSGALLDEMLAEIGLRREDVFVTAALKCRPADNRDPAPAELERCRSYLERQIELVRPRVVCTLGNAATRLLRGEPTPITAIHGQPESREIGGVAVRLYPLFHPDAALYRSAGVELLRADFARLPELLAMPVPERTPASPDADVVPPGEDPAPGPDEDSSAAAQLGLF